LLGLITQDRLREVAPSPATSLSVWELNYLLGKMTVKDVMVKDVVTVVPDTTMEEAASLGQDRGIGTLPVVDKGKLVGIITTTDVLKILTQVLGFGESGTRIHVHHCGRKKPQYTQVLDLIRKYLEQGMGLRALFPATPPGEDLEDTNIHVDTTDVTSLVKEIQALGCSVEARPH
ncbi:MAG: CBS domain-containing protein, partial [Dehalococcoidia bacterium]|nr:CBS domain-containing protein [Dehalococcoidia bacterium]